MMSTFVYIFSTLMAGIFGGCHSEENFITTTDFIRTNGYPVETHRVQTEDGFILALYRIPSTPKARNIKNKPPILLQHGLFGTSVDWVILGPEKSLGYLLADEGYDVWLGNARGNRYSRQHVPFANGNASQYWDFSWHEMGILDLPAVIDYILMKTGQKKINYIGHSMGTTMFFVLTSCKPEYNEKIQHMIALAPVAFMKYTRNPLTSLASALHIAQFGQNILQQLGIGEINGNNELIHFLVRVACNENTLGHLCANFVFSMTGYDPEQMNMTLLPTLMGHTPDSASIKSLVHYAQQIKPQKYFLSQNNSLQDVSFLQNSLKLIPQYVTKFFTKKQKHNSELSTSLLNPLNPENPLEGLNPLNPSSPFSPINPDSPLHIDLWTNQTPSFRQFDYYQDNIKYYGQPNPPDYDLKSITVPITLMYSDNDPFATSRDVLRLSGDLSNGELYHVDFKLFTHMDFIWAIDVKKLLYDEVIRRLNKANEKNA